MLLQHHTTILRHPSPTSNSVFSWSGVVFKAVEDLAQSGCPPSSGCGRHCQMLWITGVSQDLSGHLPIHPHRRSKTRSMGSLVELHLRRRRWFQSRSTIRRLWPLGIWTWPRGRNSIRRIRTRRRDRSNSSIFRYCRRLVHPHLPAAAALHVRQRRAALLTLQHPGRLREKWQDLRKVWGRVLYTTLLCVSAYWWGYMYAWTVFGKSQHRYSNFLLLLSNELKK